MSLVLFTGRGHLCVASCEEWVEVSGCDGGGDAISVLLLVRNEMLGGL